MSTQTAITPYQNFKNILQKEDVQERFKQILNQRSPQFLASLLSVVSQSKGLMDCDPQSILVSAAKAAVLNLPIEPSLGFAYIVPFGKDATFINGYKGLIQLALRTNRYTAINADAVYEGEEVTINRLTGEIALNGKRNGNDVIGYFAYFRMKNGYEKYVYMTVEQIIEHAKKYSKSWGNAKSAWSSNFGDMAKKTVLRQLLSKWGLLSIEWMDDDTIPLDREAATDPRLATPDLTIPSFDDVIDTTAVDVSEQEEDDIAIAHTLEAEGNIDNYKHALNILKTRKPECPFTKYEYVVAYNGWRDMGADSKQAAKNANAGEMPK